MDSSSDKFILKRLRFQSFFILKSFINSPFMQIREFTKTDRLTTRCRSFMDNLFPLIGNRNPEKDKKDENLNFVECSSEILAMVLSEKRHFLVRDMKKEIFDIFNMDQFFHCTPNTLKHWSRIMDITITNCRDDILGDYLNKVNFTALFKSRDSENKIRIKSFERVCFVIYSGEKDKFMSKTKLLQLLTKINEVLREEDVHSALKILILFCLRILILRLGEASLNEMFFRNIWPILLTLLIEIFEKKDNDNGKLDKQQVNVRLAALKMIELLSICNIEEFYLYQWVFMFDFYGINLQNVQRPN